MNNERYNQIIDEVYNSYVQHTIIGVNNGLDKIQGHLDNCLVEYDGYYEYFTNPSFQYGFRPHTQDEFINKCKTDTGFSEIWGLQIEERELSLEERSNIWNETHNPAGNIYTHNQYNENEIPSIVITVTYKDEKIEVYE